MTMYGRDSGYLINLERNLLLPLCVFHLQQYKDRDILSTKSFTPNTNNTALVKHINWF